VITKAQSDIIFSLTFLVMNKPVVMHNRLVITCSPSQKEGFADFTSSVKELYSEISTIVDNNKLLDIKNLGVQSFMKTIAAYQAKFNKKNVVVADDSNVSDNISMRTNALYTTTRAVIKYLNTINNSYTFSVLAKASTIEVYKLTSIVPLKDGIYINANKEACVALAQSQAEPRLPSVKKAKKPVLADEITPPAALAIEATISPVITNIN
jgi:hypothetical protein